MGLCIGVPRINPAPFTPSVEDSVILEPVTSRLEEARDRGHAGSSNLSHASSMASASTTVSRRSVNFAMFAEEVAVDEAPHFTAPTYALTPPVMIKVPREEGESPVGTPKIRTPGATKFSHLQLQQIDGRRKSGMHSLLSDIPSTMGSPRNQTQRRQSLERAAHLSNARIRTNSDVR
jgi:hypothetical protein